jgi:copper(I)-binding protein
MSRTLRTLALFLLLAAAPGAAFAQGGIVPEGCVPAATFTRGDITVSDAFTRAMLPGAPSAGGYLTVTNAGSAADTLTGATSEAAAEIQLHEMSMAGDMMKMAPVEGGIEIPPGGSVTLEPSGLHMMFLGIGTPFADGQCVVVTLLSARAGDLPVDLAIGGTAADAPPTAPMDMGGMQMDHGHQ